jgi:ectoine hydroxylase-related dioxygenase (phytanoyl-CoA dioxygenase family)
MPLLVQEDSMAHIDLMHGLDDIRRDISTLVLAHLEHKWCMIHRWPNRTFAADTRCYLLCYRRLVSKLHFFVRTLRDFPLWNLWDNHELDVVGMLNTAHFLLLRF